VPPRHGLLRGPSRAMTWLGSTRPCSPLAAR
jgi:hypothetical protein